MISTGEKNINNIAGGMKAAIKNPNVSEEKKEELMQQLHEMGTSPDSKAKLTETGYAPDEQDGSDLTKNPGNVIGGHKATLKNPNVSDEAKENSRNVLREMESEN